MTESLSDDDIRREVRGIANNIRDAHVQFNNGVAGWLTYGSSSETLCLDMEKGIQSGQLGIALFFAAMYDEFGDADYRELARDAIEYLLSEPLDDLVFDAGELLPSFGSMLYGLVTLTELTGDRRYLDRARSMAELPTREAFDEMETYGVLRGVSNVLLGLSRLYEQTRDAWVREMALACGQSLLKNRYSKWGYRVWDTHPDSRVQSFTTGMARGGAGIALALYRLGDIVDDGDGFTSAADDAVAFENVFFSPRVGNWKANWTAQPQYPTWWSYGLPGIGVARVGSYEYCSSDQIERDLERVRSFEPVLAQQDSLQRGTFAQVELLTDLGRRFDEANHIRARTLAGRAVERKEESGFYAVTYSGIGGIYNPSFLFGTAGIGYSLLRLLRPAKVPSVLRFE